MELHEHFQRVRNAVDQSDAQVTEIEQANESLAWLEHATLVWRQEAEHNAEITKKIQSSFDRVADEFLPALATELRRASKTLVDTGVPGVEGVVISFNRIANKTDDLRKRLKGD